MAGLAREITEPVLGDDLGEPLEATSPGMRAAAEAGAPGMGAGSPLDESVPDSHALVPVPTPEEPKRAKRRSLWRRLSVRRAARRLDEGTADAGSPVQDRLETIEGQLAALEDSISVHFDQLEHRFTQLWEIEDALNQVVKLPEQLTEVAGRQKEMARSLRSLQGRVRALALLSLVLAGAVAGLLAVSL
jgi:hypothetical protein